MKKRTFKTLRRRIAVISAALAIWFIGGTAAPFAVYPRPENTDAHAALARQMHAGMPSGDRAMLIESNAAALDERLRLMNTARREIIIAVYDLRDGESTRDILAMALRKADGGVKVRLLADGMSGLVHMRGNDLFAAAAAHENIEMRVYNMPGLLAPWKWMGRMHDKYLIVDDTAYILGGRNMFDYFIGDYPSKHRSHDREALVFNSGGESSLFVLRDYFEAMWAHPETTAFDPDISPADSEGIHAELRRRHDRLRAGRPELFAPPDYAAVTEATRGVWLVSNPTGLYAKPPEVFSQLVELMKLADEDVVIHSPYAVLNGYMADSLGEISENTPLTLMVNAVENGDNIVASSDYTYRRNTVLDTGAKLLEYMGGESYHGKSIAVDDDLSVIGSFNLDLRSAYVDTELMLVIHSEAINRQLRASMDALHADCRRVLPDGEEILPEHIAVPEVPLWKKAAWYVMGLALQPFRCLV